ncbi:hypothetical protein GCM10023116_47970 [Kistimonas scapharcae]|uniref:Uncharacterized protein n=1 Tax=Kistimonas scapharcae TaxID=1036133 RepID=A0ABP8V8E6_9GAMM
MQHQDYITAYIIVIPTMWGDYYSTGKDCLNLYASEWEAEVDLHNVDEEMVDGFEAEVVEVNVYRDGTVENRFRRFEDIIKTLIQQRRNVTVESAKAAHRKFYDEHRVVM